MNLEITDREVVSTRVLNAPRKLVFRAFSDPEHIAQWWGPTGFRSTIHEFDFRPGGQWRCTMRGPDDADYKNDYVFLEITKPERIVIGHPDPAHDFQLIVTLGENNGKTRLTWRQRFASPEHFKQVKSFVAEATGQNLDRLEAEVASMGAKSLIRPAARNEWRRDERLIEYEHDRAVRTNNTAIRHQWIRLGDLRLFYRDAGPPNAPILLLPHGYPCSSFQFRNLMPPLADRWRTIAPDFPGFGYSSTPAQDRFGYDFDAYTRVLDEFAAALRLNRYALWLHDYGSQIGLRHAIAQPARIAGLIIQNGDIYEDTLGPKYETIKSYWADPTPAMRVRLEEAVSEHGFRDEFVGEVSDAVAARIPPDLWKLHWPLMDTPVRRAASVRLMEGLEANLKWFPRYQAYLRDHRPPTLIVWGPQDGYMPEPAARAYLRDLPGAELHLFEDGGHWLLESHLADVVPLVRNFLGRVLG